MMKRILTVCLLLIISSQPGFTQAKHDNVWILGYPPNIPEENFGGTEMDFKRHPVEARFFEIPIAFSEISMISDSSGQLMFYTNGCEIINHEHQQMENGDSINAGMIHDNYCELGYPTTEGVMSLLLPDSKHIYYMFHIWVNDDLFQAELRYSIVDMNRANGLGEVIEKNTILLSEYIAGKISAVRHGNGRDWWIIVPKYESNEYFKFMLSPIGISNISPQAVGSPWTRRDWNGQAVFSPDGSKYIRMNPFNGLHIFDFDRCDGWFSNPIKIDFANDTIVSGGVSVSPNNRYLYVSASLRVYQFDLWATDIAASRITVAEYDGYVSPLSTTFYQHMLAPNGRIYITAPNSVNILHVIYKPDLPGLDCKLVQHALTLPTLHAFAVPNFPYFRISAKDGSPCDTLGIDMPVAIEVIEDKALFNVYPNPAQNELFIEVPEGYRQNAVSCLLFDVQGRMVHQETIRGSDRLSKIDIYGLANGFYLYQLIKGQELLQTGKIIVHQ